MRGRGKSERSIELINASIDILEEIQPASVRAVCYQLFIRQLLASMAKSEVDKVGRQLVYAREQEHIPWEWIVDETREAERIGTWDHPEEMISTAVRAYRKDYWQSQPHRVEVWSEKGTVRGTLAPVLNEYGVTFRVMHGYSSATAIHGIAEKAAENDKPLIVLYVGDWDPSGLHMSEIDLPRRIELYGGADSITLIRVAMTDVDVTGDLPSFTAASKSRDPRHKWFVSNYGSHCWELDALSPVILRERVAEEIRGLLDIDLWNHAIDVERAEVDSMQSLLQTWKNTISTQASEYSEPMM